jgi:hypothetical protein
LWIELQIESEKRIVFPCGMSGLLFLDFDGVLNTISWCRAKSVGLPPGQALTEFMPQAVQQLNRILKACDVGIVVSSSWRLNPKLDLAAVLDANGVVEARQRLVGQTPDLSRREGALWVGATRGAEIQAWLTTNKFSGSFAVLDDDAAADAPGGRHFKTDVNFGLTAAIAYSVLNYFQRLEHGAADDVGT